MNGFPTDEGPRVRLALAGPSRLVAATAGGYGSVSRFRARCRGLLTSALVLAALLRSVTGEAQITLDGTIAPGAPSGPLAGPNFAVPASAGTTRGNNLFHSFGQFNLQTGESATFTGPGSIANVINRVTGGTRSFIDGLIDSKTSMPSANFFLLNPSGLLFGPNAQLNVGGAFHASTAGCLRAAGASCLGPDDGTKLKLFVDPSGQSVLTADAPAAFGFLNLAPSRIVVQGSSLQVATGNTLSLVGGDAPFAGETETGLRIAGGSPASTLLAPGGRVQVVSVASAGEVVFSPNLDVSSLASLGRLDLVDGARLDATGDPGGSVVIRAGQLLVAQSSIITASTLGDANGAPTAVDLQVRGDLAIGSLSGIDVRTSGAGAAGNVVIKAGRLQMEDSAFIQSITSRRGAGGDISLDVGTLVLTSGASISSVSDVPFFGEGAGGPGGDVTVTATNSITIDGANSGVSTSTVSTLPGGIGTGGALGLTTPSLTLANGARLTSISFGSAAAGDIVVQTERLGLSSGAAFSSRTIDAPGGNVTVTASGSAEISGVDTGIFSGSAGAGATGNISLNVGQILLTNGGAIQSGSILDPAGGNVTVIASDSIVISGRSGISSQAFSQDVGQLVVSAPTVVITDGFLSTSTIGPGNAGPISLAVGTLTLAAGGQIASSSALATSGAGGDVTITATEGVSILGTAPSGLPSAPFVTGASSGIFSTASGAGAAGQISVSTPTLSVGDGGQISVATSGSGSAGDIALNVGDFTLGGGARIDSSTSGTGRGGLLSASATSVSLAGAGSGLFSTTSSQEPAAGAAGSITVTAPTLILTDGAKISVETTGTGDAGNVALNVGTVSLASGARIDSSTSGAGKGGIITVNAPAGLFTVNAAGLSSDTSDTGVGGDINITAQAIELANGATISARSTGTAEALAGIINIVFGSTLEMQNSSITTSSSSAPGGNISITAIGSILHLVDSAITTSVRGGEGGGGDIALGSLGHPLGFVVLDGSQVLAQAFGGPGGNIGIRTDVYLTQNSIVDASSALAAPGTINIQAQITDVSGALAQLPESVLQAATLLSASCATRLAEGKASSLVVAGREGVPPAPDGPLWSPLADLGSASALSRMGEGPWERFPRLAVLRAGCVR